MTQALRKPDAERATKTCAELEFCGEAFHFDFRGVLFWPAERMLIVSDLHLEKGSSFGVKGRFMPPYDSRATLALLGRCVEQWQPNTILSLGDSFHDEHGATRLDDAALDALKKLMAGREWIWISGNHDPLPPQSLGGLFSHELALGPINFTHEPRKTFTTGEIAGHLHPCAKIRRRSKSVRRRCLVGDENRLILPAFGAFTGGLNIRNEAFGGLFDEASLRAWFMGSDAVYCIGGEQLVP